MTLSRLPNISWNLSNNGSFSLLHCASAKLLAAGAASAAVQSQLMPCPWAPPVFKHLIFSRGAGYLCTGQLCLLTAMAGRDQRWMAQGQPWKVPRYLKKQQSPDVQLTPNTFKKPPPQSLPAWSTQTTSQCLLLYLSLKLQYYWEASGSLLLPYVSQVQSGKVFTAQTPPFGTVKMSNLSPLLPLLQHYQEVLSSILKWQLYIITVSNHLLTRFLLP